MQDNKTDLYLRCSIPTGVEQALSCSQPAAAIHHQIVGREQLGDDSGMVRLEADSEAADLTLKSPAPTHLLCKSHIL